MSWPIRSTYRLQDVLIDSFITHRLENVPKERALTSTRRAAKDDKFLWTIFGEWRNHCWLSVDGKGRLLRHVYIIQIFDWFE